MTDKDTPVTHTVNGVADGLSEAGQERRDMPDDETKRRIWDRIEAHVEAESALLALEAQAERDGIAELQIEEPSMYLPRGMWLRVLHIGRLLYTVAYIREADESPWPDLRAPPDRITRDEALGLLRGAS